MLAATWGPFGWDFMEMYLFLLPEDGVYFHTKRKQVTAGKVHFLRFIPVYFALMEREKKKKPITNRRWGHPSTVHLLQVQVFVTVLLDSEGTPSPASLYWIWGCVSHSVKYSMEF